MKKKETKSFELDVDVKSAIPIYEQIKNAVKLSIFSGRLIDGDKMLSVRVLSAQHNINPITIMKAYNQLETEGLLYSRRGAGYFVTAAKEGFQQEKKKMLKKEISHFLKKIATMGFTVEDFLDQLDAFVKEQKNDKN